METLTDSCPPGTDSLTAGTEDDSLLASLDYSSLLSEYERPENQKIYGPQGIGLFSQYQRVTIIRSLIFLCSFQGLGYTYTAQSASVGASKSHPDSNSS